MSLETEDNCYSSACSVVTFAFMSMPAKNPTATAPEIVAKNDDAFASVQ